MNVILLHGLWMRSTVMRLLGNRLEKQGFTPVYFRYRTTADNPREHANALAAQIRRHHLTPCHFVAHSLGGLVLRHLADTAPELIQGRVVTLGSPHQGSAAARFLRRHTPKLLGKAWDLGLNGTLPPQTLAWGNVAGTKGIGLGCLLNRLPEPHDGTVALAETALAGSLPLQVPCSHTGLLLDAEVAAQTGYFLRYGKWNTEAYHRVK